MNYQLCTLIIITILSGNTLRAQVGVTASVGYQRSSYVSIGLMKNFEQKQNENLFKLGFKRSIFGPSISSEFNYDGKDFIIGPKIGFEYSNIIGGRINFVYYTDFEVADIKFTPEVSLRLWHLPFNLLYGYNFPISRESLANISRNKISLFFNTNAL